MKHYFKVWVAKIAIWGVLEHLHPIFSNYSILQYIQHPNFYFTIQQIEII